MQSRETDELNIAISNLMIDDNSFDVKDTRARELIEKLNSDKVSAVEGKGLSTNDFTDEYRKILMETADSLRIHRASIANPHKTTKKTIGLSNVENKDSKTIRSEITKENVTHALGYTPISTENIGVPNGIPSLDKEGRIPSSQLPEYTPEKSLNDAKEYTRTYLTEIMNDGGDLNSWKAVTNAINENADDIQTLYNTTRLKVNTVPGKGLSTNDFTNELKEKYDEAVLQIGLLSGDATVEGSISQKLVEIVAGAPEKYDTLKEIAEWIESDTDGAAKMQSDIKANRDNISKTSDSIDDIYKKLADNGYGQFAGGKNLFNPLNCESIFLETHNCYRFGQILSGLPSGKYVLSKTNTSIDLYWWKIDSSGNWGNQNSFKEKTIITINSGDSLGIRMGNEETSFDIHGNIQLEPGIIKTDFEPFYPSNLEINKNSMSRDDYILEQVSTNRENISDLDDRLEQCFQSVSDGKATLATSLTNLGEPTASDATFSDITSNILKLANDKYADGVFDTKKGTAVADEVLSGKTFTNGNGVNLMGSMPNNKASIVTLNPSYTGYTIPKGFHSGDGGVRILTQTKTVSPTTSNQMITPDSGYVLSGVAVKAVPLSGTASSEEVISGKTFYNTSLTKSVGTMPIWANTTYFLGINGTYTIPKGYHNGNTKVKQNITTEASNTYYVTKTDQTIKAGQYLTGDQTIKGLSSNNFSSENIKSGTTISVNNGNKDVYSVKGTFTSSGTQSNGQSVAKSEQLLKGYSAWVDGKELKGTMSIVEPGTWYIDANGSYTIPAGYHNGSGEVTQNLTTKAAATYTALTVDQTIKPRQYLTGDQTIKAVSVSMPDAWDILTGSSVSVTSNGKTLRSVSGTMTNNGAVSASLNCGETYAIPTGFHNGGGRVTANSLSSQTSATAGTSNILKDYTAWVNGTKLTGNATPGFLIVAGGNSGVLQYTTNLITWNDLYTASNVNNLMFYSGSLWLSTSTTAFGISSNGFSDTEGLSSAGGFTYSGLTYGEGKIIFVNGYDNGIYYHIPHTSTKVKTDSIPESETFKAAYGHNGIVIIKTDSVIGYKLDSSLKRSHTLSFPISSIHDIAYGNGRYVVVGNGGAFYSIDGVTWTAASTDGAWKISVTFANGKFVAVGRDGKSQYSYDGATWKSISGMGSSIMEAVCCSGAWFVSCGWDYSSYYKLDVDNALWVAMSNHNVGVCKALAGI